MSDSLELCVNCIFNNNGWCPNYAVHINNYHHFCRYFTADIARRIGEIGLINAYSSDDIKKGLKYE